MRLFKKTCTALIKSKQKNKGENPTSESQFTANLAAKSRVDALPGWSGSSGVPPEPTTTSSRKGLGSCLQGHVLCKVKTGKQTFFFKLQTFHAQKSKRHDSSFCNSEKAHGGDAEVSNPPRAAFGLRPLTDCQQALLARPYRD